MIVWTYYRLHNRRCFVVGWMRQNATRTEYIGLIGDRWQIQEIPHARAIRLEEIPAAFHYSRWSRL
jgi:hypothetical protein